MAQHAKNTDQPVEEPTYIRRSRRMRRVLIIVIILLVVLLALCVFLSLRLFQSSEQTAVQQTQEIEEGESAIDDVSAGGTKTTSAPDIAHLLGLTLDEAVDQLQHGAEVAGTQDMTDAGIIRPEATVALNDETAEGRSGAPNVYLDLDESGTVVKAGYSTSITSLGYGSRSFSDIVAEDAIVEKTFAEAGVELGEGAVTLPEDSAEYSTYEDDGTTLTKESYTFSGDVDVDGQTRKWQAVLLYDYTTARATGNLNDTVRTINIYLGTQEAG